jgi:hypothetical protein
LQNACAEELVAKETRMLKLWIWLLQMLRLDGGLADAVLKNIKREAKTEPGEVARMLLECAVQLQTKGPLYALIIGVSGTKLSFWGCLCVCVWHM